MTSGIFLIEIIGRERKRPRKTASNTTITRKPFKDQSIKTLSIPLFINYYNHYIGGGVDQANQFRAVFTTHFRRNLKEFRSRVF